MKILKSKVNAWLLFVVACVFLCVQFFDGCVVENEPEGLIGNFGIYLLKDTTLKYWQVVNTDIDSLKLQDKPWLSDKIIDYYDFSSHCIYLKVEKSEFFSQYRTFYTISSLNWMNRPFIVYAKGKNCYIGQFMYSDDILIQSAIIGSESMSAYGKDILNIGFGTLIVKDSRNNENVKYALIESQKYRGGIQVIIDSIKIIKNDTSIAEYSIVIKNIDQDNLYVLDPEKAGSGRYNFYGNRMIIYDKSNTTKYYPLNDSASLPGPDDYKNIDYKWFTKIESGKSITRWFSGKKYIIPNGKFFIFYDYKSVTYWIEKNIRILGDGRIWIGPTRSNIMEVTIANNTFIINNRNIVLEE